MAVITKAQTLDKANIGSTVIGVIIGTAMTVYGQSIIPATDFSKWLLIIIPTLTVACDKVSLFIFDFCSSIYRQYVLSQTHNQITSFLKNPETSEEHKENLKRKLEQIEVSSIDLMHEQLLNPTSSNKSKRINRPSNKP